MSGLLLLLACLTVGRGQQERSGGRRVGRLQEVFAWKQITFNINGDHILQDRATAQSDVGAPGARANRQSGIVFPGEDDSSERPWERSTTSTTTSTTSSPINGDDASQFFIQYNNLPMGVERVGSRLFVTLPRRRHGIPSTLNYLSLTEDSNERSPGLRPYPDLRRSRALTSVYRTRADACNRLWMVDTGLLEIPNNRQQVQQPAVVIYDLNTDEVIRRYPLKSSDIISATTPTGLASITIDIVNPSDCENVYAYIPDLATYGLIVYSLRDNDSWRLSHNYFSFNPLVGNLKIAGQSFQWNDGIFSITLIDSIRDGCPIAYFHSMVGIHEFSVSTCVLRNRTASEDSEFWRQFSVVGERGPGSQSTMHGYHALSNVVFFADIGRDAVSCWYAGSTLTPANVEILAQDSLRLSYPSDLHVTGDEVWVMANSLPRWGYSRLDTNEYNFHIYRGDALEMVSGTICERVKFYSRAMEIGEEEEVNGFVAAGVDDQNQTTA